LARAKEIFGKWKASGRSRISNRSRFSCR
jgi:hypothetical protein